MPNRLKYILPNMKEIHIKNRIVSSFSLCYLMKGDFCVLPSAGLATGGSHVCQLQSISSKLVNELPSKFTSSLFTNFYINKGIVLNSFKFNPVNQKEVEKLLSGRSHNKATGIGVRRLCPIWDNAPINYTPLFKCCRERRLAGLL